MARTIMDALFSKADMQCTVCGEKVSRGCQCWKKCTLPWCSWSYRNLKDEKCRNPQHQWNKPKQSSKGCVTNE